MLNLSLISSPAPANKKVTEKPMGLLTQEQLADELQVCPRTIRNLHSQGLPVVKVGSDPRYDLGQVRAWLQAAPIGRAVQAALALPPEHRAWLAVGLLDQALPELPEETQADVREHLGKVTNGSKA